MKDVTTQQPLYVSTDGTAGPYIMVPVSQLEAVRQLFGKHHIPFTVDEDAISLNGEPEIAVVDLGRSGDARKVQRILDSVA